MLRNSLVLCLVLCSELLFAWLDISQIAVSQDADAENKMQVRWTKLTVRLKGDDGQAVANAAVMPYAMRMVETEGHGFWATDTLGAPKYHFSDAEGVAVIDYPARMESKFAPKGFTDNASRAARRATGSRAPNPPRVSHCGSRSIW